MPIPDWPPTEPTTAGITPEGLYYIEFADGHRVPPRIDQPSGSLTPGMMWQRPPRGWFSAMYAMEHPFDTSQQYETLAAALNAPPQSSVWLLVAAAALMFFLS